MKIVSNNHERELQSFNELGRPEHFEYVTWNSEEDDRRFVVYKGEVYDTFETMPVREIPGWDCIHSETFFSGKLFRFTDDDHVIVARYYV